jgi:hypothetical protein
MGIFPNIRMSKSTRMQWRGHVARLGDRRNAYRILGEKHEGKRSFGRNRGRLKSKSCPAIAMQAPRGKGNIAPTHS